MVLEWDLEDVVIQMNVPQTHITALMKLIVQTHKEVLLVPVKLDTMEMDTNVQVIYDKILLPTFVVRLSCKGHGQQGEALQEGF